MRRLSPRPLARALILLTALLSASSSLAVSWPDLTRPAPLAVAGPDDVALIIAVENYVSVPAIPGALQNGVEWYTYFTRTLGLPSSQVMLLRDNEATVERIRRYASVMAGKARDKGTLWFVFIGHGAPAMDGTDGLLVGFDAQQDADSLMARSMRRKELLELLGDGPQARTVALLDACFSGRTPSGGTLVPGLQPLIPVRENDVIPASGTAKQTIVLSAAASDQFAGPLPDIGRPAFSYLALGALRGWADRDADQNVTAEELRDYVQDTLLLTVRGRTQTPQLSVNAAGVVLASGVTETAPSLTETPIAHPSQTVGPRETVVAAAVETPDAKRKALALKFAREAGISDPTRLQRIADAYAGQAADLRTVSKFHFYQLGYYARVTENAFVRRYREVTGSARLDAVEGRRNWTATSVTAGLFAASAGAFGLGLANASRACSASDHNGTTVVSECNPYLTGGSNTGISSAPVDEAGDLQPYDRDARIVNGGFTALAVVGGLAAAVSGGLFVHNLVGADGAPGEDNRLSMGEAQRAVEEHNDALLRRLVEDLGGVPAKAALPLPPRPTPGLRVDAILGPASAALKVTF